MRLPGDSMPVRLALAVCLLFYFGLRFWNLPYQPVNTLFDEGVHLALMQMLAREEGALYRDFLFIHPPGVILVGAWLWKRVGGDLFLLRSLYILFCALALPPFYALIKRFYGVRAALGTLLLLAVTPGFSTWLGRTIYLELPLNVVLCAALWLLLCAPPAWRAVGAAGAGALVGLGFLIKETALPMGLCLGGALLAARPALATRSQNTPDSAIDRKSWLLFGATFLLAFGAVLIALVRIPNYLHDTFTLNACDPFSWGLRPYELMNGFYQLPFQLTFGLLGAIWMARQNRPETRFLGLYALGIALLMFCLPKRFYWRYLMPSLPIFTLGVVLWWERFQHSDLQMLRSPEDLKPQYRARLVYALAGLCALVQLTSLWIYQVKDAPMSPAAVEALRRVQESPGPLFTLTPIWAVASGHPLPSWRYAADAVFASRYGLVPPEAFTEQLLRCPTVLLDFHTMQILPAETERVLRQRYQPIFRSRQPKDNRYVEVLRRRQ